MARHSSPQGAQPRTSPIEYPGAPLAIGSRFYIERPPVEAQATEQLALPGSLLRIKAPQRMGKTSLAFQLIHRTRQLGYSVAVLDFQQAEPHTLSDLDELLHWFCSNVSRQLGLTAQLEDSWRINAGSKLNCTLYFQHQVLRVFDAPIVLFLRQVDGLFAYPETAKEFFPMLRSWFEDARWQPSWQKLRLVLTHSTDLYLPLKLHQSPFNVGFDIRLPWFTAAQVRELAASYGLTEIQTADVEALMALVGGHPYLSAIALYHLATTEVSCPQLLDQAASSSGIYSNHLRGYASLLADNPKLLAALHQVIDSAQGAILDPVLAYQLESTGLVTLSGDRAVISCELYRRYLSNHYPVGSTGSTNAVSRLRPADESLHMLHQRLRMVEEETLSLQQQLNIDDTTQFLKRSTFSDNLPTLWHEAVTQGQESLTLMLCSIDYFPVYIEANGLERGDACLRMVADVIRQHVHQPLKYFARYGTESFLICLTQTSEEAAQAIAQTIRTEVEALEIQHAPQYLGLPLPVVTVSIGLVTISPQTVSPEEGLARVDQALQQAIRLGHNRVKVAA
ncbi:MAG: AAA-like domain-containing protein [Cyanobacteria bacterium J06648_16]